MTDEINERLVEAKEAIARRGRQAGGKSSPGHDPSTSDAAMRERLPPGQALVPNVDDFPVLDLGVQPEIPAAQWRLELSGACESPAILDFRQLERIGLVDEVSDFHCVTHWSTYDNPWRGVPLARVIALAQPLPEARHVLFHGYDGYSTNVPLADCLGPGALLATQWRGRPLERKHGGPVRGMIPHLYAWKSAKWVKTIELLADDRPGFWEVRGYHNYGDPWREERFGSASDAS